MIYPKPVSTYLRGTTGPELPISAVPQTHASYSLKSVNGVILLMEEILHHLKSLKS